MQLQYRCNNSAMDPNHLKNTYTGSHTSNSIEVQNQKPLYVYIKN